VLKAGCLGCASSDGPFCRTQHDRVNQMIALFILAVLTLAAAAYAQWRLPFHTTTATSRWSTGLLLLGTGLAFGFVLAQYYLETEGLAWLLVFLSGFGLVHVPAAFILFLKRRRAAAG